MANLQIGSTGDAVKELQTLLIKNGYNLSVTGVFGEGTQTALMDYQKKNGLKVDAIYGPETRTHLVNNTPTPTPTISAAPTAPTFNSTNYNDTEEGIAKKSAMDDALSNFNNFDTNWQYSGEYKNILEGYLNRDPFSYDLNGDALYQQYKDKYIQHGKMAMQDTMGQAAAMTGGYGNSYAQSAGQQAYQNSLDNLNDIVPELYQMAYDRYNQSGQDMLNQLGVLDADYNRGYTAAKDKYTTSSDDYYNSADMYNADRDTANSLAQADYENKFNAWDVGNSNAWKQWEADEESRRWKVENEEKKNNVSGSSGTTYGTKKSYTTTIDAGDGNKTTTVDETGNTTYKAVNTENMQLFKASIKTKNEFYTRGGSDKETYKNYNGYIEGILDKWLSQGKLSEDEVASLLVHYGLA